MKYIVVSGAQFKKDLKRFKHHQRILNEIREVIDMLKKDIPLLEKHRDHALQGSMLGVRECHVRPNVLLCYKKDRDVLVLTLLRVGRHATLFSK